jgi:hypothetical protein
MAELMRIDAKDTAAHPILRVSALGRYQDCRQDICEDRQPPSASSGISELQNVLLESPSPRWSASMRVEKDFGGRPEIGCFNF